MINPEMKFNKTPGEMGQYRTEPFRVVETRSLYIASVQHASSSLVILPSADRHLAIRNKHPFPTVTWIDASARFLHETLLVVPTD